MQSGVAESVDDFEVLVRRFEARCCNTRRASPVIASVLGISSRRRLCNCSAGIEHRSTTRRRSGFSPVCRNRALNVCRKERRMLYLDDELMEARPGLEPAPYEQLEQKEASGFLLRIVATLPPRQQEVLQLKFQNDFSYQEISEITKLSVSNVGVLIHTALKTLRVKYAKASREFVGFNPRTAS
jgi:hypothetical protein